MAKWKERITLWFMVLLVVLGIGYPLGGIVLSIYAGNMCRRAGFHHGVATADYRLMCSPEPLPEAERMIPLEEARRQAVHREGR